MDGAGEMIRALADARGATAIEYALIAGGIALVIIAAIALLGDTLNQFYQSLATALGG